MRDDRWARLLEQRWIRFPFLLREGSVVPWDLSGLLSTPERLMTHLLGTHHDGLQFVYDMRDADARIRARSRSCAIARARWSSTTRRARAGCATCASTSATTRRCSRWSSARCTRRRHAAARPRPTIRTSRSSPTCDWCALQPATPRETWRAWRAGRFTFAPARAAPLAAGR